MTNPISPDNTDASGRVLAGRYRLERKLAEGGMGAVYRAIDQQDPAIPFAVKMVIPRILREHPGVLELLREEVRKSRALGHPNIVSVYSFNEYSGEAFIVMEYMEGKTLDQLLVDFGRGMPMERAWPIIQDLGKALAHVHDRSVVHGDLKPSNLFVTTSGIAKLLDFGVARATRGAGTNMNEAVAGSLSPPWASCEMLEGQEPDVRDDIYGFACILYELLSGKRPFGRLTAVEARDTRAKRLPIASLNERQNRALAEGLAFERELRTARVESLLAELSPVATPAKRVQRFAMWQLAGISVVAAALVGWLAYETWKPARASVSATHGAIAPDSSVKPTQIDRPPAPELGSDNQSVATCASAPAALQIARSEAQQQLDLLHSLKADSRCASLAGVKTYFDLGVKAEHDNDRLTACRYYTQTTQKATVMVGKLRIANVWSGAMASVAQSETQVEQMTRNGYGILLNRTADERHRVTPRASSALLQRELAEADAMVTSAKNEAAAGQYGKAYGDANDALNFFYRIRRQEEGAADPNVEVTAEHLPNPFLATNQAPLTNVSDPCSY